MVYFDPFPDLPEPKEDGVQQPIDDDKPADGLEIADQVTPDVLKTIIAEAVEQAGGAGDAWRVRRRQLLHWLDRIERNMDYDLRFGRMRNRIW